MTYIIILIGIAFVISYVIIRIYVSRKFGIARKRLQNILDNWTKITVSLSECSVKSNNYSHEVIVETGKAAGINAAFGRDIDNVKVENVYQSVIFCTTINPNDGKRYTYYSDIINKDQKTVEIYCNLNKTADLFINPTNPEEYHFNIYKLFE